jgi:catechol 2,3-dioxygenase-like lactoylglutathione lyase family enzyme
MSSLKQIFLMSADLEATREFYETAVGLEPREVGESSVAYETGSAELKIEADFAPEELEAFNLSPPAERRGEGVIVVLGLDQPIAETYERMQRELADAPGELLIEPREVPWGGRMFLARDPDGYVLELRPPEE